MAHHTHPHNYRPLPPSEDQLNDKETASSTASTSPSKLHTRAQTSVLVLLAFLAGALLSPIAQKLTTTVLDTGAGPQRLQKLLTCEDLASVLTQQLRFI